MATEATAAVVGDLHRLLTALLKRDQDGVWGHSKLLLESIECAGQDGLPARTEIAAVLAKTLSCELTRMLEQPRRSDH